MRQRCVSDCRAGSVRSTCMAGVTFQKVPTPQHCSAPASPVDTPRPRSTSTATPCKLVRKSYSQKLFAKKSQKNSQMAVGPSCVRAGGHRAAALQPPSSHSSATPPLQDSNGPGCMPGNHQGGFVPAAVRNDGPNHVACRPKTHGLHSRTDRPVRAGPTPLRTRAHAPFGDIGSTSVWD
jgi:hypothetical protein